MHIKTTMNRYIKLFGSLSFIAFTFINCGNKNLNNITPNVDINQNKIYFSTTDYINRNGHLYGFDVTTNNVNLERISIENIDGIIGFQSRDNYSNLQNLYLSKYINSQSSSVVMFSVAEKANEINFNLPENIYDIMLSNNSLYYVGYDKKEIAMTDSLLNSVTLPSKTVQSFSSQSDANNFVSLLNQDNNFYTVSVGYSYKPLSIIGAYIYALDSSLSKRSAQIPNAWPVADNGKVCYDLNSTVRLSHNKIVVACNPEYTGAPLVTTPPSIFLIDVSSTVPVVKFLKNSTNENTAITLGGISNDRNYVLVTEENEKGDYNNPTVYQSYWLNIENKSTIAINGAYNVTYNNTINSYLFSCVLNNSNQCQNNKFGIAKISYVTEIPSSAIPVTLTNFVNINGVHGISFFKDL